MAMTIRENYMEAMTFGNPEYVPYTLSAINILGIIPNTVFEVPVVAGPDGVVKNAKDLFGVEWTATADGGLPVNGHFLLDDITRWKEVVTIPNVDDYPWEQASAQELAMADPNKVGYVMMNNGIFDRLVPCTDL